MNGRARDSPGTGSLLFPVLLVLACLAACRGDPEEEKYRIDRSPIAVSGAGVISIEEIEAHLGPASRPPDTADGWVQRSLPDFWSRGSLGQYDDIWYRVDVELASRPDELWALYLPRLRMNAEASINGVPVGTGGGFGERVTRNWNRPLYFTIPSELLRPGPNRIDLHVGTSSASDIRLVAMEIGPDRLLHGRFAARVFRQVDLRYLMVVLSLATALLLAVVALRRPEIKGAGYFTAALLCLALASSDGIVREPPMPVLAWQWLNVAAYMLGCACVVSGANRALGAKARVAEWLAWGGAVAIVSFVLVDPYYFVTVNLGILSFGIVAVAYVAYRILDSIRRGSLRNGYVLLTLAGALLALAVHDVQSGFTGLALPYAPLTTFVPLVIIAFTTWMLMGYVLESLSASERLAEQLNERVEVAREELQENYERLREMERGRLVAQERDRMMREMHDGIGGQLVSALALLERNPPDVVAVGESLREGLDDMRQMLDSVAGTADLPALLGSMRARLERRLLRHGLQFEWKVREVSRLPVLGPAGMGHVLRIVQEAVNNVVGHAEARTIRIETCEAEGPNGAPGVRLDIADDGRGMPAEPRHTGQGLANMRSRAEDLGGTVEIRSTREGTEVRLWLPSGDAD